MLDPRWQARADAWNIGDLAAALAPAAHRCFHLENLTSRPHVVGASRFGGGPDLPVDVPWPAVDGRRLDFVAQLDLASLEPGWLSDLPASGHLWIFVDASGEVYPFPAAIFYRDAGASGLRSGESAGETWPARSPLFVPSFGLSHPEAFVDIDPDRLSAVPSQGTALGGVLPRWDGGDLALEMALDDLGLGDVRHFTGHTYERFEEEVERHATATPEWARQHARHLDEVVRPKRQEWLRRRSEVRARAAGYRALAVLESEDELGWCWGDAGVLVFLIHEEDLRARRFDRVAVRLCSS